MSNPKNQRLILSFLFAVFIQLFLACNMVLATPAVTSLSPTDDATGVSAATSTLVINFDQDVVAGMMGGNITLYDYSDDSSVKIWDINDVDVSISSSTVTISNLATNISNGNHYYVLIDNAAITDSMMMNDFAGYSSKEDWDFEVGPVADTTAPSMTSLDPADDASLVCNGTDFTIKFDEDIQNGSTGNIKIYHSSGGAAVETIAAGDARISVSSNGATIDPNLEFLLENGYYFTIDSGVFEDLASNAYTGFTDNGTWNFTINDGDCTLPTVSSFSPADDFIGASQNGNLVINFNKTVTQGTAGNFVIKKTLNDSVVETIAYNDFLQITYSSSQVTINPDETLELSTGYYVTIDSTAIQDASGNFYAGISDKTTWNFTVSVDDIYPQVDSFCPTQSGTRIPHGDLILGFTEDVNKISLGTVEIRKYSDDSVAETFYSGSTSISITNNIWTLDMHNYPLTNGVTYYVTIDNGSIKDDADLNYAGIAKILGSGKDIWNFTIDDDATGCGEADLGGGGNGDAYGLDVIQPYTIGLSPANNATGVAIDTDLILHFNENIVAASGTFTIKDETDVLSPVTLFTIDVTDPEVSIVKNVLTINPGSNLPENAVIVVEASTSAIEDLSMNPWVEPLVWSFNTVDTIAPILTSSVPADNATDISITTNLSLTFNEDVLQGTTGNLTILNYDTDVAVQTFAYNSSDISGWNNGTITVSLADLSDGTHYYVTIGSSVIQDAESNFYAGISSKDTLDFTTVDSGGPSVVTLSPADNATGVGVNDNLVMGFDEDVQAGTGNIIIKLSADDSTFESVAIGDAKITISGNQVTLNPAGSFASSSSYYVNIASGVIEDLSSNAYAGITGTTAWNFTAADVDAPVLQSSSPSDGASSVAVGSNISFTFDEVVNQGSSGSIILKKYSDDSTVESFPYNSGISGFTTNTLTINPSSDLDGLTRYYIDFASTVAQDASANFYAGFSNKDTLDFTSIDTAPPEIEAVSHSSSQPVYRSTEYIIDFNKDITLNTSGVENQFIVCRYGSATGTIAFQIPTSKITSVDGDKIKVNLTDFVRKNQGTKIFCNIAGANLEDSLGNQKSGSHQVEIVTPSYML